MEKGLEKTLKYDENGKPKLDLIPMLEPDLIPYIVPKEMLINTSTPKDYDAFMQVCECGGRTWAGKEKFLPTQYNIWGKNREKTCIQVPKEKGGELHFGHKDYFHCRDEMVISLQRAYHFQKITPEMLREINQWFELNKPNRESKKLD